MDPGTTIEAPTISVVRVLAEDRSVCDGLRCSHANDRRGTGANDAGIPIASMPAMLPVGGQGFTVARGARGALQRLAGQQSGAGVDANHMFPRKFRREGEALGIDWDDASNMTWWYRGDHQQNAYHYNRGWNEWFRKHNEMMAT